MTIKTRLQQRAFATLAEEALVGLILVAEEMGKDVGAICQRHGITHDQYNVLRILRGAGPDGLPRCDIAQRMISRSPDATRMIDRLVKQGLVVRGWSEENRRLSISRITEAGLAVLAAIQPELEAMQARWTAGIPEAELTGMIGVLDRMLARG
ncbi:MAG TPA: MarR family transcriptional regulator [Gemmatimonadales bacterium]|nr:MarR family transcriptional regulator [Gemmatimonadales bacterium]